jgi:hypothetical protein
MPQLNEFIQVIIFDALKRSARAGVGGPKLVLNGRKKNILPVFILFTG